MKTILSLFITSIFLLMGASAEADEGLRVIVFGDSLTSGYQLQPAEAFPIQLRNKLKEIGFENIEVLNFSNSEDTTAEGVGRIDAMLLKHPDVVVLAFGVNDALRGINPGIIYRNIAYTAARLQQERIYTILMGIKAPASRGATYGQQLTDYYRAIADNYGLPFYENALEGIAEKSKYTVADGYRPTAQGVDIMVEGMYRLVDAGLRWRIDVLKYQDEYRKSQQPQSDAQ
jgi:acyl-CoA thioesterase I